MNSVLRRPLMFLALVVLFAPTAHAGPFRDFFKKVRHTFTQSENTPPSSHKPVSHRPANTTPHKNVSAASSAEVSSTHGPPDEGNTRAATAVHSKKSASADLRYGTPVPGKKGFVTSPFAPNSGYVDVRGFPPGTQVKDPYSGKVFLTP